MQESIEAVGEFVVTSREATKLLEPIEESLNEVTRFVALLIKLARRESVATRRNDGLGAHLSDRYDERIAVVSPVSDDWRNGILRPPTPLVNFRRSSG